MSSESVTTTKPATGTRQRAGSVLSLNPSFLSTGDIVWHSLPTGEDACSVLGTNVESGLTDAMASERRTIYGANALTPPEKPSIFKKIWDQVSNLLVALLFVAAVISGILEKWPSFILICVVVVLNVVIGLIQEGRAEEAAAALAQMMKSKSTVIRSGERKTIDSSDIVPGDLVFIQSGDRVPADLRLVSTAGHFTCLEAILTGESLPVAKNTRGVDVKASLGDRKCIAYSGTMVMSGSAIGVAVETADFTALGQISLMVSTAADPNAKTNLMVQVEILGRVLTVAVLVIALVTLFVAHFARDHSVGLSFEIAVTIAVAIIPEGLAAVFTITMAVAVQAMAKENAIIRQLPAVEVLGTVNVICSDKTGTLTKNEMTAVALVTASRNYRITGAGYNNNGSIFVDRSLSLAKPTDLNTEPLSREEQDNVRSLLSVGALCNDSALAPPPETTPNAPWSVNGDPTELAILSATLKSGITDIPGLQARRGRKAAIPFESEHKFMGTVHAVVDPNDSRVVLNYDLFVKGAPDRLIPRCAYQQGPLQTRGSSDRATDSPISSELTPIDQNFWLDSAAEMSSRGLRCLALCRAVLPVSYEFSTLSPKSITSGDIKLVMCGLIAIMDPPREEAISSIKIAHNAGIVVKMITGDHPATAVAIGKILGIVSDEVIVDPCPSKEGGGVGKLRAVASSKTVYTGTQLDELTDAQLDEVVLSCNVFARASPENKIRIVKALQRKGQVCSMTGDGVNDAPALKAADIGVAMGITGTDVSKEAAKMVLADDNFASIVSAVRQGRRVFANLRKILLLILPTNLSQGLVSAFAIYIGMSDSPLTSIQILYVNMITSVTIGIACAFEPAEPGCMNLPPRLKSKRLLGKQVIWRVFFVCGMMMAVMLSLFDYNLDNGMPVAQARAEVFSFLAIAQAFYALAVRYSSSCLHPRVFQGNGVMAISFVVVVGLQVLVVHVPVVNEFFSSEPMNGEQWGRCFGLSFALFLVVELEKFLAPRFIMPVLRPLMARVSGVTPKSLSFDQDPNEITFYTTSAATFGIPTHSNDPIIRKPSRTVSTSKVVLSFRAQRKAIEGNSGSVRGSAAEMFSVKEESIPELKKVEVKELVDDDIQCDVVLEEDEEIENESPEVAVEVEN